MSSMKHIMPSGWTGPHTSKKFGNKFYHHTDTGETRWAVVCFPFGGLENHLSDMATKELSTPPTSPSAPPSPALVTLPSPLTLSKSPASPGPLKEKSVVKRSVKWDPEVPLSHPELRGRLTAFIKRRLSRPDISKFYGKGQVCMFMLALSTFPDGTAPLSDIINRIITMRMWYNPNWKKNGIGRVHSCESLAPYKIGGRSVMDMPRDIQYKYILSILMSNVLNTIDYSATSTRLVESSVIINGWVEERGHQVYKLLV